MKKVTVLSSCLIIFIGFFNALIANPVKYTGSEKEKKGKNLVLIASDHEYRAEETIPALARILGVFFHLAAVVAEVRLHLPHPFRKLFRLVFVGVEGPPFSKGMSGLLTLQLNEEHINRHGTDLIRQMARQKVKI